MLKMPCSSKNLTSYRCACARDLHGNMMYVIRMLNSVCLSLLLDMFPPGPKIPFGQRNVATYIHNICKWHLWSRGGCAGARGSEQGCRHQRSQHTTENLNIRFRNIPSHQLYKYIKSLVVGVVEQLFILLYRCLTHV